MTQYVIVDAKTGLPVYRADGRMSVVELPEGSYLLEWLEIPVDSTQVLV